MQSFSQICVAMGYTLEPEVLEKGGVSLLYDAEPPSPPVSLSQECRSTLLHTPTLMQYYLCTGERIASSLTGLFLPWLADQYALTVCTTGSYTRPFDNPFQCRRHNFTFRPLRRAQLRPPCLFSSSVHQLELAAKRKANFIVYSWTQAQETRLPLTVVVIEWWG